MTTAAPTDRHIPLPDGVEPGSQLAQAIQYQAKLASYATQVRREQDRYRSLISLARAREGLSLDRDPQEMSADELNALVLRAAWQQVIPLAEAEIARLQPRLEDAAENARAAEMTVNRLRAEWREHERAIDHINTLAGQRNQGYLPRDSPRFLTESEQLEIRRRQFDIADIIRGGR